MRKISDWLLNFRKPLDNHVLRYRRARNWAKAQSLVQYLLQTLLCFLVLGPLLSRFVFGLLGDLAQVITGQMAPPDRVSWPSLLGIFFSAPLGFGISLAIDYHEAPLSSCWPYHRQNARLGGSKLGPESFLPNRVLFAQPGQIPGWFWGRRRGKLFWIVLSLGLGFLAISAGNMLLWLLRYFGWSSAVNIKWIFAHYTTGQAFLLLVVFPSLLEELVYRGRGFALLSRCWGAKSAVWLSSLCFAASHFSESIAILPLALYLGWLRSRSGNLGFAMLVHLQNNSLAFFSYLWFEMAQ